MFMTKEERERKEQLKKLSIERKAFKKGIIELYLSTFSEDADVDKSLEMFEEFNNRIEELLTK